MITLMYKCIIRTSFSYNKIRKQRENSVYYYFLGQFSVSKHGAHVKILNARKMTNTAVSFIIIVILRIITTTAIDPNR